MQVLGMKNGRFCQKRSKMGQKTTVHRNSGITGSRNGHADNGGKYTAKEDNRNEIPG